MCIMASGNILVKDLLSSSGPTLNHGSPLLHSDLIDPEDALDTLRQAELMALYRFWHQKTSALGRLPGRADFSPLELKKLLPHIALVDVTENSKGLAFKFRLCGTQIAEGCGTDLTGYSWNDAQVPDAVIGRTHDLVTRKVPYHARNIQAVWAPKSFQHYSVLALPLAADGDKVDMILYGIIFHPKEDSLP